MKSPMTLNGERLVLRPVAEDDLPVLLSMLAEPEVSRWWGEFDEPRLRRELEGAHTTSWVIAIEGSASGLVNATEEHDPDYRHAELDVFLDPKHHGRGLGADALRTALRHLFEERGHHRAVIAADVENERAIRCYRRVGFRPIGVTRESERGADGNWHDELLMDMLASELC